MPTGTVIFTVIDKGKISHDFKIGGKKTRNGSEVHNFAIAGLKWGALISPGQSETWTVPLPPTTYNVLYDVPFHVDRGMVATIGVTS